MIPMESGPRPYTSTMNTGSMNLNGIANSVVARPMTRSASTILLAKQCLRPSAMSARTAPFLPAPLPRVCGTCAVRSIDSSDMTAML